MATEEAWAKAYRRQARSEYDAACEASTADVRLMLLQMVFEKIAKAAMLASGQWTVENTQGSHQGATHLINTLATRRNAPKLGYKIETLRRDLAPLVNGLENLNPAVARATGHPDGPWLEYPWPAPDGERVLVPAEDLAELRWFAPKAREGALLLALAKALLERFDGIFG